MTVGIRQDPLRGFNFLVQLVEPGGALRAVAGFAECGGLESTLEVMEYQEGGVNDRVHKFPTRMSFGAVTLKRGVTLDPLLRAWHQQVLRGEPARRDGLIQLLDEARRPALAWRFERGLPTKWSGPMLNASSSETAIESLEIAVERIEVLDVAAAVGGLV